MAAPYSVAREARGNNSHRRPAPSHHPPMQRSRQSWASSGNHIRIETVSYVSPEISLGGMAGGSFGHPRRAFSSPLEHAHAGILGNVFGLLDDFLPLPHQPPRHILVEDTRRRSPGRYQPERRILVEDARRHSPIRRRMEVHEESSEGEDEELAYGAEVHDDDDEGDYGNDRSSRRRRSLYSRLRDKLREGKSRSRRAAHDRESSPTRQRPTRMDSRPSSYHTETRAPTWAQQHEQPDSRHDEEDDDGVSSQEEDDHQRGPPGRSDGVTDSFTQALERTVEGERIAVITAKRRLEVASQQPTISTEHLQSLLNDIKEHELSMNRARKHLENARMASQSHARQQQSAHFRSPPIQPPPSYQQRRFPHPLNDSLPHPMAAFPPMFAQALHPEHIFRAFENLHAQANAPFPHPGPFFMMPDFLPFPPPMDPNFHAFTKPPDAGFPSPGPNFANPQRKRTRFASANGPQYVRTAPLFAQPPAPPPPTNLLQPAEARRLFATYNERWTALAPTDPAIPYPARDLAAPALRARETVWAPRMRAHAATAWSEEFVLQANAVLFFLGAVGLAPAYSEGESGRPCMGFERSTATGQQVRELVEVLKREKVRWHSDRLGRRNGGTGGVNGSLQGDEAARAVFHAVCGLMEFANEEVGG